MLVEKIRIKIKELRLAARDDLKGDIQVQLSVLKTLYGEIESIAKKKDVDDTIVQQIIAKFVKNNEQTQRHTLDPVVARCLFLENQILESFLPKQLTESQLADAIGRIIELYHDTPDMVNMGMVMKELKAGYGGQYDGKIASQLVREALKL